MIKFASVKAIPLSKLPAKVLITWATSAGTSAELKDYEFRVLHQHQGQDGDPNFQDVDIDRKPKTPLPASLTPKNSTSLSVWIDGLDYQQYVDYSDTLKNLTNACYYRVECRNKKTQESVVSDQFTWEGELDHVGLYICDETNFLLKDVTGVPSVVFQRRRGGAECRECFDPIQKKRLKSNCLSCYGTNWLGGFFQPIDTFIDFNPNPKNTQIESWGEIQSNETQCLMSNYPSVDPGDVIRELGENRVWRVVNVTVTEKRRCQMLQFVRLSEVKPGDVEYRLPNDERFQVKKSDELSLLKKKPEF